MVNGSLYKANVRPGFPKEEVEVNAPEDKESLQLYHERWGHQDKHHLRNIIMKEFNVKLK